MAEQVFNVNFVGEIEKRPALYNYTLSEYSRKDITEKLWKEIAEHFSMTVGDCKERWRNLHAVFVRHMRPVPSGSASKSKKPYYLTEAMKFTLPYIKAICKTSGNLPDISQQESDEIVNDSYSDNQDSVVGKISQCEGSHQSPQSPPISLLPETASPPTFQQGTSTERHVQSTSKRAKQHVLRNDVDNSLIEFFKAKISKLAEKGKNTNPRSEALKMFLLSMLPDLEAMSDVQVRQFKRRCLQNIDDILSETSYPSSSLASPQTSHSPSISDHSSILHPLSLPLHNSPYQSSATEGYFSNL